MSKDLRVHAQALGVQLELLYAGNDNAIDAAFTTLASKPGGPLLVTADPFFFIRRAQITALAARHAVPAIYPVREDAEAGGLMSYGASVTDMFRQAGIYTGRVLKGEKPADLPVMRPTKFEFVINLATAKALTWQRLRRSVSKCRQRCSPSPTR